MNKNNTFSSSFSLSHTVPPTRPGTSSNPRSLTDKHANRKLCLSPPWAYLPPLSFSPTLSTLSSTSTRFPLSTFLTHLPEYTNYTFPSSYSISHPAPLGSDVKPPRSLSPPLALLLATSALTIQCGRSIIVDNCLYIWPTFYPLGLSLFSSWILPPHLAPWHWVWSVTRPKTSGLDE